AVTAFARSGDRGLIVTASASALVHRKLIVALRPGTSCLRCTGSVTSVTTGGLISYGADYIEQYRRAAGYVDRIQGREGRRPARASTDQVRTRDQPEARQVARPGAAAERPRPRRRGDRVKPGEFVPVLSRPCVCRSRQDQAPPVAMMWNTNPSTVIPTAT